MSFSATRIATQRATVVEQLATVLTDATPVLDVVDFNVLDYAIELLQEAYWESWWHPTVSVSTMRLPGVLEHLRARGIGVVTRSSPEVEIARHSGYHFHELIHHAPVKTRTELTDITDAEFRFSIDNFTELTRVDELLHDPAGYAGTIGLCVTPQASADDNATTNAHLGFGLVDHRQQVLEAYLERAWLTQLHVSFDQPPVSLQQAAEQVAAVHDFAEDLEHAAGSQRITGIHLDAGIPVNLDSDEVTPSLDNHRFVHHAMIPHLFDGKYEITADYSDFLTTKAGMTLARVEYTKDLDGRLLAITHADAQPAPHTVRVAAFESAGTPHDDAQRYYYDVVGSNGLVAQQIPLPSLAEGDILAILDVGATRFGARSTITTPVYGIRADGLLTESSLLHPGTTVKEQARAAGVYQPAKLLH